MISLYKGGPIVWRSNWSFESRVETFTQASSPDGQVTRDDGNNDKEILVSKLNKEATQETYQDESNMDDSNFWEKFKLFCNSLEASPELVKYKEPPSKGHQLGSEEVAVNGDLITQLKWPIVPMCGCPIRIIE
ncbi:hypothetical protein SUGI_0118460 [Cryptomeria japonica]|nr:hypothetical protein SUGI_0118460 [Cryptomeria japonica]